MCTLIVLHRCLSGLPLLVAANRDEFLDRPSEGLALREMTSGPVLAPLDRRAGGTWLGLNANGVFAAVTNRPCPEPDPTLASRGRIVFQALASQTAAGAVEELAALPSDSFNPFNAVVADVERAFVIEYEGRARSTELAPGAHVIGNAPCNDRSVPKVARILRKAEHAALLPADEASGELAAVLREHECRGPRGPLDDSCVHAGSYGTRSSALLELRDTPDRSRLHYADGAPCRTDYQDFTTLLRELTQGASYDGEGAQARKAS